MPVTLNGLSRAADDLGFERRTSPDGTLIVRLGRALGANLHARSEGGGVWSEIRFGKMPISQVGAFVALIVGFSASLVLRGWHHFGWFSRGGRDFFYAVIVLILAYTLSSLVWAPLVTMQRRRTLFRKAEELAAS